MEGDPCHGRARAFRAGGGSRRGADRSGVSAVRDQPGQGLQVAAAVAGGGRRRARRPVAGAAAPPAGRGGGAARGLPCAQAPASDLGAGEGEGGARAAEPRSAVAGGEHDRRALRPRGADGQAQDPAAHAARRAAVRRRRGQRRLGDRLQGLVPHRRRHPHRPLDAQRREQPVSAALPGGDASRRRACLADPRRRLPRAWPAAEAALRQRTALRDDGRGRALPPLGQRDQGRRHPRAHHPGQAAGERPA